ncbi:hypothetical protein D3C76_1400180 [compost metagenome]
MQREVIEFDIAHDVAFDQLHDVAGRACGGLFDAAAFAHQQEGDDGNDGEHREATAQIEDQLRMRLVQGGSLGSGGQRHGH